MMLVYFPSGRCVDDVANNRANYQFSSVMVIHFINGAGVCWIIKTVFNVYICSNHSWKCKLKQIERCDEKPRYQWQFFQNLDNFQISVFFVNNKSVLLVAFAKYTLSKLHSHYTQNFKFYYFIETRICLAKKSCSLSS